MRLFAAPLLFTTLCAASFSAATADIADDCYRATLEVPAQNDRIVALCSEALRSVSGTRRAATLVNRGVGYMQKGNLDAAMGDFNESIRLNPKDSWARSNRANVWRLKRRYDRAINELNDLLRRDPGFIGAYVDRGMVHQEKGDIARAREDFQAVLGMRSDRPEIEKWAKDTARQRLDELARR
jgi:tetratricopeptide (TPR) repeat protein